MTQVIPGEDKGIESALRQFNREVSKAGIFSYLGKYHHLKALIEERKRKAIAKHKQSTRKLRY